MDALEIIGSTGQAAFAVDLKGTIIAWNVAAERLFSYTATEAIGAQCWKLLSGRDIHGNDYCAANCPLRQMVIKHRPLSPSALIFRTSRDERISLRVFLMVLAGEDSSESVIAHLLCPLDPAGGCGQPAARGDRTGTDRLTRREFEVLGLLVEGRATHRIARRLGISRTTVRNHVQRILCKLGVHSRLEAVALARGLGIDR